MVTLFMVHGQGEFFNTLIALTPDEALADSLVSNHPTEWQKSVVEVETPFTLISETPFTPA